MSGLVNFREARQAIRVHFKTDLRDSISEARVAWENRRFVPPEDGDYWVRETTQIVHERNFAMDLHQMVGRTQFDVFYPRGKSVERVEDLCQLIGDSFEKKRSVTNNDTVVGIETIERNFDIDSDDAWWMGSVAINWRSFSPATLDRTI